MRFFRSLFRPALWRRFIIAMREEGLGVAAAKVRIFVGMQWRGEGPSALDGASGGASTGPVAPPEAYLNGIWQQLALGNAFHVSPPVPDATPFVAIIGDLNLPQCRKYRVEQLAAFWQAQGIACEHAHYQDLPRVVQLLSRATRVIEYRLQSTPMTEMIRYEARRLRLPILYDIDDPLFSVTAYETYGNMSVLDPSMKAHFLSEAPKYLCMMNGADMVSVSTPKLAEHARLLTRRPVHVRRNFADQQTLGLGAHAMRNSPAGDGTFRVAFASGSQGHEADFAIIVPALEAFFAANEHRKLLLLGHLDLGQLPDVLARRADVVPFSTYDRYLTALAQADCAVMPLADDTFNHCKSAVRVIDAASVSLPSVVGMVGDLQNVVQHGKTGIVARSTQDWIDALTRLDNDRGLAAQMGQAARHDLENRWVGQVADHIIDPEIVNWVRG